MLNINQRIEDLANEAVLRAERREAFLEMAHEYHDALSPRNIIEFDLVHDITLNIWRRHRVRTIETALIDHEADVFAPMLDAEATPAARTALSLRMSVNGSKILEVLSRLDTTYGRSVSSSLRLLCQFRKATAAEAAANSRFGGPLTGFPASTPPDMSDEEEL
jgi:hypothetical protein